jgi:hypothetical protein
MLLPIDPHTASTDPFEPGNGRGADRCAGTALPVTPDDFCGWLAMAMPGSATVYHRGHLGRDRCRSTTALSERDRQELITLARQALIAAEDGRVHLLQRRHSDGDYSYIAVKSHHRLRVIRASARRTDELRGPMVQQLCSLAGDKPARRPVDERSNLGGPKG